MNIQNIKPYEKNAKKHDKKQIQQIANSIKEFGFNQPIVIDKDNVVIVGHGRLEAAKLLGLTDVPTIQVNLTEEQAKAYRLADNKLNESEWDMGLAIEELKGLSEEMFDLTGFDKDLLIEPDAKDDVIPEDVEPVAKLGDIWQLGRHRVMCGDSTLRDNVEKLMDGKKADMVFTDPPYGMDLDVGLSSADGVADKNWGGWKGKKKNYSQVIGDDKPFDISQFSFLDCKEQFWWGGDYYVETIPNYGKDGCWFVWNKTTNSDDKKQVGSRGSQFELCWSKQKHTREVISKLWRGLMGTETQDIRSRVHPTQKPVEICSWFINKFSKENEIIIDLFMGSGSTLIACEQTNRICYGMELDPKYVDVIIKRWEDYTGNKAIKL